MGSISEKSTPFRGLALITNANYYITKSLKSSEEKSWLQCVVRKELGILREILDGFLLKLKLTMLLDEMKTKLYKMISLKTLRNSS